MKAIIFVLVCIFTVSALEFKTVKLSPVDGQVYKSGIWIVK